MRRLPGALGPSFLGKLLFLLLCTAGMPLLGLLCGELCVLAVGASRPRSSDFVPAPSKICGQPMPSFATVSMARGRLVSASGTTLTIARPLSLYLFHASTTFGISIRHGLHHVAQ